MQKLLIVIDMQNDFVTGVLGSPEAVRAIEPIRARVAQYRKENHPVLFTMDTHLHSDYHGESLTRESASIPKHCIKDTDGWELVPALRPYAGTGRIEKPGFLSPDLADQVRSAYGEELEFLLCGVCTDICVVSNALVLRGEFPRCPIAVDPACCAGTTPENHAAALRVMKSCLIDIL